MKKLLGMLIIVAASLSLAASRLHSPTPPAEEFVTEAIDTGRLVETISATGTLQPRDTVMISAESPGRVVKVFAELHQVIKPGEALAQLDDRLPQLRVQQAKVAIDLAQAEVLRAEAGRDAAQKAASDVLDTALRAAEAGLTVARTRVREAQVGLQLAELAVEQSIVRSPIAGIVIDKRAVAGQLATGVLFTVAPELEKLQLTALVAEGDIGRIKLGQVASFTVNSWPDATIEGKVTRIAAMPATAGGAVQYPVTIDASNSRDPGTREYRLRPGMPASIDIALRQHDRVWKLPAAAASVQLDEAKLSEGARKKLARWKSRGDAGDWQRVWTVVNRQPWPIYLRVGGKGSHGETGIRDLQSIEILAWDPEEQAPKGPLRVLTATPASAKPDKPGLKLF